jgi:hypothetical protein
MSAPLVFALRLLMPWRSVVRWRGHWIVLRPGYYAITLERP